jgi:hypothetical protein
MPAVQAMGDVAGVSGRRTGTSRNDLRRSRQQADVVAFLPVLPVRQLDGPAGSRRYGQELPPLCQRCRRANWPGRRLKPRLEAFRHKACLRRLGRMPGACGAASRRALPSSCRRFRVRTDTSRLEGGATSWSYCPFANSVGAPTGRAGWKPALRAGVTAPLPAVSARQLDGLAGSRRYGQGHCSPASVAACQRSTAVLELVSLLVSVVSVLAWCAALGWLQQEEAARRCGALSWYGLPEKISE